MESEKKTDKKERGLSPGPEVEEFANALDSCLAPGLSVADKRTRVLDLPRKYHENAIRRLIQKKPKRARDGHGDVDMDAYEPVPAVTDPADVSKMQQLEKEVQTWDLVRRLLPLRYPESRPSQKKSLFSESTHSTQPASARSLDELFDTDPILKERRAVIQWLQTNASSGPDIDELARELQQNADRGDVIAYGWLHTRTSIKHRKRLTAWPHLLERQSPNIAASHVNSDGAPLVTNLDPDAAMRQARKLEPQDDYFERAIWLGCFEHLRRGSSLDTIRDWCQERTEMWRAVSMSGILLPADGKENLADAPPPSIALWRRMCLSLARNGGADDYERAVYGLLAGDITSVEKVAKTWDDFVFANYNALLRTQIDNFLLGQCPPDVASGMTQSFPSFDAIQFHGDPEGLERRLIVSLESQKSTMEEALEPNKALQASLIANDIDRHLYEQALVITNDANKDERSLLLPRTLSDGTDITPRKFFGLGQHDGLRIVAHIYALIALLRHFDALEGNAPDTRANAHWQYSQESIVAAYTGYLFQANLDELIPLYCSILAPPRQYEVLSWNMIHEQEAEKRVTQLKLIKRVGIDVLQFVETLAKLVFEDLGDQSISSGGLFTERLSILMDGPPTARLGRGIKADFFGDDDAVVAPKEENAVRSLEWLLEVEAAWPEVLSIGVQVYKHFFKRTHLLAARKLMERVQFDSILQNITNQEVMDWATLDDVDFWAQQLEESGITTATPEEVMTNARNFRELECLAKALDGLETLGSMVAISAEYAHVPLHTDLATDKRSRAPTGDRNFWTAVGDAVKTMKERMQPLLGGWLLASIEDGDEELAQLRQDYLPETILGFVSGLHCAGTSLSRDHLLESMELATIVAERNSDLTGVFVKAGRMTELVEAFAACSKALAVATGEKRATGSSSKKLREMGWSRDLWAIKQ
ncbi:nuclear pore complex protein [Purpureocillium lavendulum]|uniref:Nuclear pore complex protein n=1 Tax=Purpureocillium lavendulum TaxID=1247861 RepID=A0AB34G1Q8_9HYPO|nr:nuclear pore complex protein [Purpureocillium lavendulum]